MMDKLHKETCEVFRVQTLVNPARGRVQESARWRQSSESEPERKAVGFPGPRFKGNA